jgi:hypothetical protein
MAFYTRVLSGWLFDAEANAVSVIEYTSSYGEMIKCLKCKWMDSRIFPTSEGAYCVYFNENRQEGAYNESAELVLGKIPCDWGGFNGNFLVTYMVKLNLDEDSKIPHHIPDISFSAFVDACVLSEG